MSGITPIIDTLLHQVLGRREAPVERPLPETLILPAQPGHAPAKAYSDSRLDPRTLTPPETRTGAAGKPDTEAAAKLRAGAQTEAATPTAAAIRFSSAARTIAEVLARFPAPPSALRIAAPLLARDEPIEPARLALLLRASIEASGLFYEAHLNRWRSGSLPLQRLLSEPQMLWTAARAAMPVPTPSPQAPLPTLLPLPAPATPAGQAAAADARAPATARNAGGPGAPLVALTYSADGKAFLPLTFDATTATAGKLATGDAASLQGAQRTSGVHPALDGILRQQLELLAAPVLHWEGAPWSGVFMTLTLQPPTYHDDDHPAPDERDAPRTDPDAPWRSQLVLRLARLGQVNVDLHLHDDRVAVELTGEAPAADRMETASPALRTRLGALGFDDVSVQVRSLGAAAEQAHG